MKMPFPFLAETRDRERGAVAMLVAIMWTALFGMAVLAVDFGYLYTKRRGVQAAADAAVRSSMPLFTPGNRSAADTRAILVAGAAGYAPSATTTVTPSEPGLNQYRVRISAQYPTFFGSLFGLGTRSISGQATARLNGSTPAPAIFAGGAGCNPAPFSGQFPGAVQINGSGQLVVLGDIATATDKIQLASWGAGCAVPGTCRVTGQVRSSCAVIPDTLPPNLTLGGTPGAGIADPLLGLVPPACTVGTLLLPLALPWQWNGPGNCYEFATPNEIYCSSTQIQVIPPGNANICASGTFISPQGFTVQTDGSVNLTASTAAPLAGGSRLLAYTTGAGDGTCGNASMWITAGALVTTFTLNGTLYAPNGCIHVASDALTFNSNGLMDGKMVFIEMGTAKTWTFTGPGGLGGGGWAMVE